jgi:alpha-tubulin suppressor-like RCC1 family protein
MADRRRIAAAVALIAALAAVLSTPGPVSAGGDVSPMDTGQVWQTAASGALHTCGVRLDHSLWCWGYNDEGQLGLGDLVTRRTPTQVGSDADWLTVATGYFHTCGIRVDHTLWCWGYNEYSQLGLGDESGRLVLTPTQVGSATEWAGVSPGNWHTCAVKTDHTLWCWGANGSGELGIGWDGGEHPPTRVGSDADWADVEAGSFYTCGLKLDASLWCWGGNPHGELGMGDTWNGYRTPTRVASPSTWTAVRVSTDWWPLNHTCGLRSDGTMWCWGWNRQGQVGSGDRVQRLSPSQVGPAKDWRKLTVGADFACGIRAGQSLWCWGGNRDRQLGLGGTHSHSVPKQTGKAIHWASVQGGLYHACGVGTGHALWCWGNNAYGQLGLGDLQYAGRPTRV